MKARGTRTEEWNAKWLWLAVPVLSLLLVSLSGCESTPGPDERGVGLGLFASDVDWDYEPLVIEIADLGATDVLIVVPLEQQDIRASFMTSPVPRQRISKTLATARAQGLRVGLMPIIQLRHQAPGEWRGRLDPTDRAQWFEAYSSQLDVLAELSEKHQVHRLIVGSELCSLEDAPEWGSVVDRVRSGFSGRLSYSANWDQMEEFSQWKRMDDVGVTAYFPVDEDAGAQWRAWLEVSQGFADRVDKPLLITEVGYPSRSSAAVRPWDHGGGGVPDAALQERLLRQALDQIELSRVDGMYVWNWFGFGGHGDIGYTPRGKPAAIGLKSRFHQWARARSLVE